MSKFMLLLGLIIAVIGFAVIYPIATPAPLDRRAEVEPDALLPDSDAAPTRTLNLLFIHHSVGGHLLADHGEPIGPEGNKNIWQSHPNGGGLRRALEAANYQVHEVSYGSQLGENTELFDWLPKFQQQMPQVLHAEHQDKMLAEGRNQVVMFKSCFPNSFFRIDKGATPSAAGPTLTLSNAQATMRALRDEFAKQPDTLFVYLTAPPLRAHETRESLLKYTLKKLLGRVGGDAEQVYAADTARVFNNWVKSPQGWLKDYPHHNIAVFDYYDVLTEHGKSNFLRYPSADGSDDHPSSAGQQAATAELVPFLNRAIRHAGIEP